MNLLRANLGILLLSLFSPRAFSEPRADGAALSRPATSARPQEASEPEKKPAEVTTEATKDTLVSKGRVDGFLESLGQTSRDAGRDENLVKKTLRRVLTLRLRMIDRDCDVRTSHELLLIGYAFQINEPGAEKELRRIADYLSRRSSADLVAVTPMCRAALRGFGKAIMETFLGDGWSDRDEERLRTAIQGDD